MGQCASSTGLCATTRAGARTLYLDYEAYREMAIAQMQRLAAEAVEKFGVRDVAMVHRLGRLQVGETSVLIVVASAHRAAAFDACRWLIDTLKKTVPIWKKETFVDGAVWADGEPFPAELAARAAEVRLGMRAYSSMAGDLSWLCARRWASARAGDAGRAESGNLPAPAQTKDATQPNSTQPNRRRRRSSGARRSLRPHRRSRWRVR